MILGLDVSTSTIGYCVLSKSGDLLEIGYIPLAKEKEITKKGAKFASWLSELILGYTVTAIYIEEPFQRYSPGMSSARTITRLAAFNGITQYICFECLGFIPELISVHEARKTCGIKTQSKKKTGKEVKEQVFEWVEKRLEYNWPTKILQSGPRKGLRVQLPETRDMADAWVVAQAGFVNLQ